jgi:hypothetical protein
MSARADYLKWRRQPAVGCVFARLMSTRPRDFGQRFEEVSAKSAPSRIAASIAKRMDIFVADKTVSAATLLLPDVITLKRLTTIVLELRAHSKWDVTTTLLEGTSAGDVVAFRVVRHIPFQNATCPSEALALGPFRSFPPTRRAPVTALEVFVGEPMPMDPKTHSATTKANLAHMDLSDTDLEASQIDTMWEMSKVGRLRSLGGSEDDRAKAKVSFVIPLALAQQLGCVP